MNKKVSFATLRPDLLADWDIERNEGIDPKKYSANSRMKGWGCPYDAGKLFVEEKI